MTLAVRLGPVVAAEAELSAVREIACALDDPAAVTMQLVGPRGEHLQLPASVQRLLGDIVHELARGSAVTVVPVQVELTTQQAADLLNVSRPFLIKLVETGQLPFHRVGRHRRVRLVDLLVYRQRRGQERRSILAEMARDAQELGLYE